jgi:hypothetical protein
VVHISNPSIWEAARQEDFEFQASLSYMHSKTLSPKI